MRHRRRRPQRQTKRGGFFSWSRSSSSGPKRTMSDRFRSGWKSVKDGFTRRFGRKKPVDSVNEIEMSDFSKTHSLLKNKEPEVIEVAETEIETPEGSETISVVSEGDYGSIRKRRRVPTTRGTARLNRIRNKAEEVDLGADSSRPVVSGPGASGREFDMPLSSSSYGGRRRHRHTKKCRRH